MKTDAAYAWLEVKLAQSQMVSALMKGRYMRCYLSCLVFVIAAVFVSPLCASANQVIHERATWSGKVTAVRVLRMPVRRFGVAPAAGMTHATISPYIGTVRTLGAILTAPNDITYNPDDGNLYVLDNAEPNGHSSILRVEPDGGTTILTTLSSSQNNNLVYDHTTRKWYVTSSSNAQGYYVPAIYSVDSAGNQTILAGGIASGFNDGTGTQATLTLPTAITVDYSDGALYFIDQDRVRRVTTSGKVTTVTGPGSIGGSYGTHPGIAFNPIDHNLYVADASADVIRKVSPGGSTSVFAGGCVQRLFFGTCDPLQRDGQGINAFFASPSGIRVDPTTGVFYVTDSGNNMIRR